MVQLVKCLPQKYEDLGLSLSTLVKTGVVTYACSLSTREAETGRSLRFIG